MPGSAARCIRRSSSSRASPRRPSRRSASCFSRSRRSNGFRSPTSVPSPTSTSATRAPISSTHSTCASNARTGIGTSRARWVKNAAVRGIGPPRCRRRSDGRPDPPRTGARSRGAAAHSDVDRRAAALHRAGRRARRARHGERRGRQQYRRKLDPQEFRGFALADELAPLVFINGADTKAAQMFTLAHELAHVWLGQSACLGRPGARASPSTRSSAGATRWRRSCWCRWMPYVRPTIAGLCLPEETARLARRFKVSTLVVLRRIHDAGGLNREAYWAGL